MCDGVRTGAELIDDPPPLARGKKELEPSVERCAPFWCFLRARESSSNADTGEELYATDLDELLGLEDEVANLF